MVVRYYQPRSVLLPLSSRARPGTQRSKETARQRVARYRAQI